MQRRLAEWATENPEGRYRDLWNLISAKAWLEQAYRNVAENRGANTPGVDGATRKTWEKDLDAQLEKLRGQLRAGTYQPKPARRVYIPKKDGRKRPLGIPTLRDRVVQEAVRMAIEPIFESDFLNCSHGFRPTRSTHDAMAMCRRYMIDKKRMYYVIEGDIKGYFDAIHHRKLMTLLRRRIRDKRVLNLIWAFLKAGVMEDALFQKTEQGTPQGGVISPLLANIYLHELDRYMYRRFMGRKPSEKHRCRRRGGNNAGYVRYADDFVVFCNGHIQDVRTLKEEMTCFLEGELHLTLCAEKTAITHVNKGFEFLGFRFHRGKDHLGQWKPKTAIPPAKVEAVREKVRDLTSREHRHVNEAAMVTRLNAVLRGWGNYYKYTPHFQDFNTIDRIAYRRLVKWYAGKYRISPRQVMQRRHSRAKGNRRLFAEWQTQGKRKRIHLVVLVRDIPALVYAPKTRGNPYLQNAYTAPSAPSQGKAGCGESRTSGLGEGA